LETPEETAEMLKEIEMDKMFDTELVRAREELKG
jgi:hypothetical protein